MPDGRSDGKDVGRFRPQFPIAMEQVEEWGRRNGVSRQHAAERFVSYAVLDSIAGDDSLNELLVLRGSGALSMFYGLNRRAADLDFVHSRVLRIADSEHAALIQAVNAALSRGLRRHFRDFAEACRLLFDTIKVEVAPRYDQLSINRFRLPGSGRDILVCSLEYLLAEKLVSLVRQAFMGKPRGKDVYDIAEMCRLNKIDVTELRRAFWARVRPYNGLHPRPPGCFDDEVKEWASRNFNAITVLAGQPPRNFEECWACVLALGAVLPEPERSDRPQILPPKGESHVASANS